MFLVLFLICVRAIGGGGGKGAGGQGGCSQAKGVRRFPKMLEGARTPVRFLIVLVGRTSP